MTRAPAAVAVARRPRRLRLVLGLGMVCLGALGRAGPGGEGVAVEGVVTYDGPRPDPVPVPESGGVRELVEVDPGSMGLKDAVVWLDGGPGPDAPGPGEGGDEPVVVDQRDYAFVPHVVAIRAGRAVEFRNSDAANHGVIAYSITPANRFSVTTPPGGRTTRRFEASEAPVAIGCPIHVAMSAWVYVFEHRRFAVTDDRGRFRLPAVPPGRYTLHVRHPDGGMRHRREVVVGEGAGAIRVEFHGPDLDVGGGPAGRRNQEDSKIVK